MKKTTGCSVLFLLAVCLMSVFATDARAAGTLCLFSTATYNGSTADKANDVAVDPSGNIIVTGYCGNGTSSSYFTIKYDPELVVLASATYKGAGNENQANHVAVDASGNIIVTGFSNNGSNDDYVTIKYSPALVLLASATYNGGKNERAFGVAADASGNIIVTGYREVAGTSGSEYDYMTIKYSPNLVVLSSAQFSSPNGSSSDFGYEVAVDSTGNIIVAGSAYGSANGDLYIIKYSSGLVPLNSVWYAANGSNLADTPNGLAIDSSGNIFVAMTYQPAYPDRDYRTLKFSPSLGAPLAVADYSATAGSQDESLGLAVDKSGHVIVTGHSLVGDATDYFTIKYDNNLVALSSASFNGYGNGYDQACGVAVDASENIIVTGQIANGADYDFCTVKYSNLPTALSSVSPASVRRGQTLNVTVAGTSFPRGSRVAFGGSGIAVNSVTRVSATQLTVNVTISTNAVSGKRDVTVITPFENTAVKTGAFEAVQLDTQGHIDEPNAFKLYLQDGGELTVSVAAGTFSEGVNLFVTTVTVPSATSPAVKPGTVAFGISNDLGLQPEKRITITLKYSDAYIAGLDESKLVLCRYDGTRDLWIPLPTTVDAANNVLTATTDHLSTFVLVQLASADTLAGVKCYPNPYNPKSGSLILSNLTGEADIKIYNVAGELVRTVSYDSANGRASWDGKNDSGNTVASGVYLAFIKNGAEKKMVKIAVER